MFGYQISSNMLAFLIILLLINNSSSMPHTMSSSSINHQVTNASISGLGPGCKHQVPYIINGQVSFQMCTGQTDEALKHGSSIINLIGSRGYLPTCRIMQLMLWMASDTNELGYISRDHFIDVGANIGSCSVHMAALGFPVIALEPVQEHVDTIRGSISINPFFHLEVQHLGIAGVEKIVKVNFGHGARNVRLTHVIILFVFLFLFDFLSDFE